MTVDTGRGIAPRSVMVMGRDNEYHIGDLGRSKDVQYAHLFNGDIALVYLPNAFYRAAHNSSITRVSQGFQPHRVT
jgi:hypothetical protein